MTKLKRARRTPCPKGSGQEELPHVHGQGQWPRVPDCNSTGTAERSYPVSKVRGGDERSYPASEVKGSVQEEIPLVQGKEQQLRFARAAVKRYPTPKVR